MTGWNLPPGCNVSDLPGNRPEDEAAEAAYDAMCERLLTEKLIDANRMDEPEYDNWVERLITFIMMRESDGHIAGYSRAIAEQKEYEAIKDVEKSASEWVDGA